ARRRLRPLRRLVVILRLRVREARDRERTKQTEFDVRQTQSHGFLQFQANGGAPLPLREAALQKMRGAAVYAGLASDGRPAERRRIIAVQTLSIFAIARRQLPTYERPR